MGPPVPITARVHSTPQRCNCQLLPLVCAGGAGLAEHARRSAVRELPRVAGRASPRPPARRSDAAAARRAARGVPGAAGGGAAGAPRGARRGALRRLQPRRGVHRQPVLPVRPVRSENKRMKDRMNE
eukprot:1183571-Prorocentrum_minimum.AAC.4